MSERKLAHIEIIEKMEPIEGKDRIVLATVLGWTVIVQKADYNVGDKVVFCEIDSVFPSDRPEFSFLEKSKYRIKTMKMAGVLSQGICFPLGILPEGNYKIGDDVTGLMGITQYARTMDKEEQPPEPGKKYPAWMLKLPFIGNRLIKSNKGYSEFPAFVPKTDEVRIQNAPQYLNTDIEWVATEKVDGQSGTFALEKTGKGFLRKKAKYDFAVCSRNLRKYVPDNSSYWYAAKKYDIENVLRKLIGENKWVAIQGECIAPDVQGNKYKVREPDLYCFNLIYPTGRVDSVKAKEILGEYGLKFVPVIETGKKLKGMSVGDVLAYSNGRSALGDTPREGIVFRSSDGQESFKAVSPDFLIKYNE